jgi:hypothetical protein
LDLFQFFTMNEKELDELRKWFEVRDHFMGLNCRNADLNYALQLALNSGHENAALLCRIFGCQKFSFESTNLEFNLQDGN